MPILKVANVDKLSHLEFVFKHPKGVTVAFEFFFPGRELTPTLERERRVTRLSFSGLLQQKPLSGYPFNDAHAYVLPKLVVDGQSLDKSDPGEFKTWYLGLIGGVPPLAGKNRQLLDELVADRPHGL